MIPPRPAAASPAPLKALSAPVFPLTISGVAGLAAPKYATSAPRPLIEDNSVRSKASYPVSARLGYKFEDGLIVRVDGFNLLNREASQFDYFYGSRLASEPGEVEDIHFHPLEPRSFRLSLTKQW
jgi:outer membrane receptor protein involved in Fe transport